MGERADGLVGEIEKTIDLLESLDQLVSNFYDDGADGAKKELNNGLKSLTEQFATVDKMRNVLGSNATIPGDFLDHLDRVEKCNPQFYTRHKVDFCLEEKERKRRIDSDFLAINQELDKLMQEDRAGNQAIYQEMDKLLEKPSSKKS